MTALEELYLVLVHIQLHALPRRLLAFVRRVITPASTSPPLPSSPITCAGIHRRPSPLVGARVRHLDESIDASSPIARGLSYAAPWTRYCRPPMAVMAPTMMANGGWIPPAARVVVKQSVILHHRFDPEGKGDAVVVVVVERDARKSSRRAWDEGRERRAEVVGRGRTMIVEE